MQIVLLALMTALNLFSVYIGAMALFTLKRRRPYPKAAPETRFAVIIPARNESKVIANLLRALKAQRYPADKVDVYVAINHCTDDTEAISLAEGVTGALFTLPLDAEKADPAAAEAFVQSTGLEFISDGEAVGPENDAALREN